MRWLKRIWAYLTGKSGAKNWFEERGEEIDRQMVIRRAHANFRWNDNLETWLQVRRDYGTIGGVVNFHDRFWNRSSEDREEQKRVNSGELDTPNFIVRCDDVGYWGVFQRNGGMAGQDVSALSSDDLYSLYRRFEGDLLMQFAMNSCYGEGWQDRPEWQNKKKKWDKLSRQGKDDRER